MTATATTAARPKCRHCDARLACRPRGLCFPFHFDPGVRAIYPAKPNAPLAARGLLADPADDRTACLLELYSGLLVSPSSLGADEWVRLLARLPARLARVVVLRVLHGMTHDRIGERLGYEGGKRSCCVRPQQMWDEVLARLRRDPAALAILGEVSRAR